MKAPRDLGQALLQGTGRVLQGKNSPALVMEVGLEVGETRAGSEWGMRDTVGMELNSTLRKAGKELARGGVIKLEDSKEDWSDLKQASRGEHQQGVGGHPTMCICPVSSSSTAGNTTQRRAQLCRVTAGDVPST